MRAARSRAQKQRNLGSKSDRIESHRPRTRTGWVGFLAARKKDSDRIGLLAGQDRNKAPALEQSKRATLGVPGRSAGEESCLTLDWRRLGGACARLLRRRNWIATNGGGRGSRGENEESGVYMGVFYLFILFLLFFFSFLLARGLRSLSEPKDALL